MTVYQAYNLDQSVIDLFGADYLVVVASLLSVVDDQILHRNKMPATELFSDVLPTPYGNGYHLVKKGVPVAYVEEGNGSKYRYYNAPEKEDANMVLLLEKGDIDVDLCYFNPKVEVTSKNGVLTIFNETVLNHVRWREVQNNIDIQGFGLMWVVTNVKGTDFKGHEYIGCGNHYDFNRGSGRKHFCKITKNPTAPKTVDFIGTTDLENDSADYIYPAVEILDPNVETLNLKVYHGLKATEKPFIIPLKTLFENA